jgi:hypothetical protein
VRRTADGDGSARGSAGERAAAAERGMARNALGDSETRGDGARALMAARGASSQPGSPRR